MKKNYLFAVAFVAAALTGCSQEELVDFNSEVKSSFTATMETVESRTVLDANNKVQWVVNDDHVSLFEKVDINAKYQVSSVDDNGTAKLAYVTHIEKADYQTLDKYYAVYPYSDANTIGTDGTITAPVSDTYTYKDKESCIASALMVARSESKSLRFTNAQGIIRLRINAQTPYTWGKIQSITFTSKANYLSGTAIMSWNGTETPVAVIDTEASKGQSLTINLDESLKKDLPSKQSGEYAEFYVPVVPTTFAEEDLTMVVKFAGDKTYTLKDIKKEITIARKEIITLRHTIGSDDFSADIEDEVVSDEISNEAQLIKALQTGGKYTLMDEVTLTETVKIPEGIEVTLDLNKQALTGNILAPNATLTVENGTLKNSNPNVSAIEINEGELNLNDVTIESARHAVRIDGDVTATINGGTYKVVTTGSGTYHAVNVSGSANVTIKDGTFIGPKGTTADSGAAVNVQAEATVTIEDGNFSKGKNNTLSSKGTLTVSGGTFDQNPSAFVAEGFAATKNDDGTYSVVKGTTAKNAAEFIQAINDVKDGDVIALSGDVNFTADNRTPSDDRWYEGIYYIGDKSFTLDLGGKTIKNESGAVNDYMLLFKNEGSKANTITIKNGKIDAGTTAFCAIATSATNSQQITIDLENVELINNNSNGATAKIRGNAILNVKAGTKITGKDSYTCMEIATSTANIYEGAELYQNGTSNYVGSLIGVSGGGTINIYGGIGVSQKCGIAVYSTGGTINAMGGDWTANVNGTVPTPQGDNNLNVLLVQNNTNEASWRAPSIMNVSGGTYRGGISSAAYTATSEAKLNITGGNFNCDPSAFCKEGHEATESNGIWTVE